MKINNLKVYTGATIVLAAMVTSSCQMESQKMTYSLVNNVSEKSNVNYIVNNVIEDESALVDVTSNIEKAEETVMEEKISEDENYKDNSITISFTGDCTLGTYAASQYKYFDILFDEQKDYDYYFENVKEIFESDDYTVVNLEGPLTDATSYQSDKPFAFKGPKEYINILTHGGVEAVNLSNNHIFDYYDEGYNDTINVLKENNVDYFDNNNFHIEEIKGVKFGFAGFKAFNLYTKVEIDKALKYFEENDVDTKIIVLHGGVEYNYQFDTIKQELAHYAIDNGVDLVVGHHPHILQGIEEYNGKYIIYSLGNFCYGGHNNPSDKSSMIAQVTFNYYSDKDKTYDLKLIPVSISSVNTKNNFQPTPLKGEAKEKVLKLVNDYSENFVYSE